MQKINKLLLIFFITIGIFVSNVNSVKKIVAESGEVSYDLMDGAQTIDVSQVDLSKNYIFTSTSQNNINGIRITNSSDLDLTFYMTLKNCYIKGSSSAWNSAINVQTKVGTKLKLVIYLEGTNYIEGYNWAGIVIGDSNGNFGTVEVVFATKEGSSGSAVFNSVYSGTYALQANSYQLEGYNFSIDNGSVETWTGMVAGTGYNAIENLVNSALTARPLNINLTSKNAEDITYTLEFNTMGGNTIDSYTGIVSNAPISLPSNPTKSRYDFAGWYKDTSFNTPWNDSDTLSSNMTLYAKYTLNALETPIVTSDVNGTTITFEVEANRKLIKPTNPVKNGYDFVGWYKDEGFTTEWNFSTDIANDDMVLYAKFTPVATPKPTVTGNVDDSVITMVVTDGNKIIKPNDPFKEGYKFDGWYKEAGFNNKWNFDTDTVSTDTVLYAKFTELTSDNPEGGLPIGAVIGIIVGGLVGLILIVFIVLYILWKKSDKKPLSFLIPVYRKINKLLFKTEYNNVELKNKSN